MQTIVASAKSPVYPSHYTGYNLGVLQRDYNGRQVYWHTGGADGFVTNTCFVPEENLGIAILTNNDNQEFFELLRYQILDAYFNLPYRNYSTLALNNFMEERQKTLENIDALKARIKNKKPPFSLNAYTGEYMNPVFGKISIRVNAGDLIIKFNQHNLTATLQYMDSNEWMLSYSNPAYGIFPLKFVTDGDKVVSVDIKVNDFLEFDPYTFTKQ